MCGGSRGPVFRSPPWPQQRQLKTPFGGNKVCVECGGRRPWRHTHLWPPSPLLSTPSSRLCQPSAFAVLPNGRPPGWLFQSQPGPGGKAAGIVEGKGGRIRFKFAGMCCTFLAITFEDVSQILASWYHSIAFEVLYRMIYRFSLKLNIFQSYGKIGEFHGQICF